MWTQLQLSGLLSPILHHLSSSPMIRKGEPFNLEMADTRGQGPSTTNKSGRRIKRPIWMSAVCSYPSQRINRGGDISL